ncbi:MAG: S8 family serine peptidase [Muribaculum sp.]|nr:S8 family serine peptidase [Muribaculum sp.]
MKRIIFGNDGNKPPRPPFWQPWGFGGFLGRFMAFLALTGTLMILLSLLPRCTDAPRRGSESYIPEDILHPEGPRDLIPVDSLGDWYDNNITDPGEYLPAPEDNFIPPYSDDDIVTDPEDGRQYISNAVNVMLDSDADNNTFRSWSRKFKQAYPGDDYKVTYYDPLTKLLQISVPKGRAEAVIRELPSKITDIRFKAFPDGLMGDWGKPSDPAFGHRQLCWLYSSINAYSAWDVTMGNPDVTVAVVDTFFDLNHDELNSRRIYRPFSIINRNANVLPPAGTNTDEANHGTFVAGLAVGNAGNGRGACGIAPKCRFMPISMGSHLTSMTMLQGLLYAVYQGADVVNISAGAAFDQQVARLPVGDQVNLSRSICREEQAVWDYAFSLADQRKVTVVWAAGNESVFAGLDPSKRCADTVIVSATTPGGGKAKFSNFGNVPSMNISLTCVSAPGQSVFSTIPSNTYDIEDGTSFSAPIVAGAVALMKSVNPNLSNRQIVDILRSTGSPVAGASDIGPLLNIRKAIDKARA